ncbi:MAG: 1-acyl-sn-glycerol-3-phosphate acyltransferase [Tannerellaceae bacterium]|jgi:1-acyl-sn-glycerol-3-phosphate acyltransferase|nr:1-acyl-sn-glycerol-3-phosphate acyltransferase [Tannerellaceae bacterium]
MQADFIDVRAVLHTKAPHIERRLPRFLIDYLIRIVHQHEINHILRLYHDRDGVAFMYALLDYFDIHLDIRGEEHIPPEGRFIFASNHPLGGMDGICLSAVIGSRFDGKIRYPVNDLLLALPNLRSIFIPVNKHGRQDRDAVRQMEEAYASDNQIVTFPAGKCSRRKHGRIMDVEWQKSFVRKAIEYRRDIIPVHFSGRNSDFFYRLANIRTALGIPLNIEMLFLADEMFRAKHSRFGIRFAAPIRWETLDCSRSLSEWAAHIRTLVCDME